MLANVPRPGRDFFGAARYLIHGPANTPPNPKRVLWTTTRNLASDDPTLAAKIMTATARVSVRVERPVYHLIISWSPEEMPARDAIERVVDTTLADIGLSGHQALLVAHGDTSNSHVHVMVNRVHADTGVAWSTSHDYARIERSIFKQASAMGFRAVPGRHSEGGSKRNLARVRARGAMLKARKEPDTLKPWTRIEIGRIKPQLELMLEAAPTWDELHRQIDAFGGAIEVKGQGQIIRDNRRTGYVKLSALGKQHRLGGLETRFGESFADHATRRLPVPATDVTVSDMDVALGFGDKATINRACSADWQSNLSAAPSPPEAPRWRKPLNDTPEPEDTKPTSATTPDQEPESQR